MTEPAPSFLVINVSRIGDTLLTTPALAAIATAYPRAAITMLAHPKRVDVIRNLPFVPTVGTITKKSAPWRGRFGGQRHDYALVYGFDEALVAYALRVAGHVVAFRQRDDRLNQRLYRSIEPPPLQSKHAVTQVLLLPNALGIPPAGFRLKYQVTDSESRQARTRLAADVPGGSSPLVGIHVSTFPKKTFRRWPLEHFHRLAECITETWPSAHFLIFGGNEEIKRTRWLKDQLGDRATLYAGKIPLREAAALMSFTDLYIGLDTGPTHIMGAFNIPMVVLFHCLIPSRDIAPLEHPSLYVVDHPRARGECTEQTPMAEITVETVFAQVVRALTEHPPRDPSGRLP